MIAHLKVKKTMHKWNLRHYMKNVWSFCFICIELKNHCNFMKYNSHTFVLHVLLKLPKYSFVKCVMVFINSNLNVITNVIIGQLSPNEWNSHLYF